MTSHVRAGIIGLGAIAAGYGETPTSPTCLTHAKAYLDDPRTVLVAGCDPSLERRQAFERTWGPTSVYSSAHEMLDHEKLDIVSVCSSSPTHADIIHEIAASPAKPRVVICEKPLAENSAAAVKAAEACERAEIKLIVDHTRRFDPAHRKLQTLLATNVLGEIQHVRALYGKGIRHNGVHVVDILLFLLGGVPDVVQAVAARGRPEDPNVDVLARYGDTSVHLAGCDAAQYDVGELDIIATRGRIRFDYVAGITEAWLVADDPLFPGARRLELRDLVGAYGLATVMRPVIAHAVDLLDREQMPWCGPTDAILGLSVIDAIMRSLHEHSPVEIPGERRWKS